MSRRDARSLWLVENLFDEIQFSSHTISASSSPAGAEAYRVATARRSAIDAWAPTSENTTHWVEVDCGAPRIASLAVIDRGHNLDSTDHSGGFVLEGRSSTGHSWVPAWTSTDPLRAPGPGASTTYWGARTFEGALLREFSPVAWRYWRLRIPPSTGFSPIVRNLALGLAYCPTEPALPPSDYDATAIAYDEIATPSNWRGVGRVAVTKQGSALYRLASFGEYEVARSHLVEYEGGRIGWYVPRRGRAEEARCVQVTPVDFPKPMEPGYPFRILSIPYREHEPLPL